MPSNLEEGLRAIVAALFVILLAVAFAPWALLIIVEWLMSPRFGSWQGWQHIVGAGWAALVIGVTTLNIAGRR